MVFQRKKQTNKMQRRFRKGCIPYNDGKITGAIDSDTSKPCDRLTNEEHEWSK